MTLQNSGVEDFDLYHENGKATGEKQKVRTGLKGRARRDGILTDDEFAAVDRFQKWIADYDRHGLAAADISDNIGGGYEHDKYLTRLIDSKRPVLRAEAMFKRKGQLQGFYAVCRDDGTLSYTALYELMGGQALSKRTKVKYGKIALSVLAAGMLLICEDWRTSVDK